MNVNGLLTKRFLQYAFFYNMLLSIKFEVRRTCAGCHSCGDTYEEALANIREAAQLWLDCVNEEVRDAPLCVRRFNFILRCRRVNAKTSPLVRVFWKCWYETSCNGKYSTRFAASCPLLNRQPPEKQAFRGVCPHPDFTMLPRSFIFQHFRGVCPHD